MKVVLFCGGEGMRMRNHSDAIPKPMVEIGYRPLLWHIMKYYSHYGHKEFILCLGYKADVIKNYFLNYNECLSNDFVLRKGLKETQLLHKDITDWSITFVDTGLTSNLGERLMAVKDHLIREEMFMANYADGLTDLPLSDMLEDFKQQNKIGCFFSVKPNLSFHAVTFDKDDKLAGIQPIRQSDFWINGGYFIFRKEVFDYIKKGEELVEEPFQRMLKNNKLTTFRHDGFWAGMDTFKDKMMFDELYRKGNPPWMVWNGKKGS
ncbi:MAG TPA: glucose-1-phosphate cytidylyltransferase [Candidatus Marinimicrobia bacterium]|nr:glucose-1-phosphate cytidylyltransferase [Candidatus Neomarinimicrobiota bacterium]